MFGKELILGLVNPYPKVGVGSHQVGVGPAYCMSTYSTPPSLYEEFQKKMNSFWWGKGNRGLRGINWMSWDKLIVRKDRGGMGFCNL